VHIGPSMLPTLRPPDVVEVKPYNGNKIHPGDIIVFRSPKGDKNITHRVIAVTSKGVKTRGDNNNTPDPWLVELPDIVGRVYVAHRGQKDLKIPGGEMGKVVEAWVRSRRFMFRATARVLRPLTRFVKKTKILPQLVPSKLTPHLLSFKHGRSQELHLMLGNLRVGRRIPGRGWQIKIPFRFFIDTQQLPLKQ